MGGRCAAAAWQAGLDVIDRLPHLAAFPREVRNGRPQVVVRLTRVTADEATVLEAVPRGMLTVERLLLRPEASIT